MDDMKRLLDLAGVKPASKKLDEGCDAMDRIKVRVQGEVPVDERIGGRVEKFGNGPAIDRIADRAGVNDVDEASIDKGQGRDHASADRAEKGSKFLDKNKQYNKGDWDNVTVGDNGVAEPKPEYKPTNRGEKATFQLPEDDMEMEMDSEGEEYSDEDMVVGQDAEATDTDAAIQEILSMLRMAGLGDPETGEVSMPQSPEMDMDPEMDMEMEMDPEMEMDEAGYSRPSFKNDRATHDDDHNAEPGRFDSNLTQQDVDSYNGDEMEMDEAGYSRPSFKNDRATHDDDHNAEPGRFDSNLDQDDVDAYNDDMVTLQIDDDVDDLDGMGDEGEMAMDLDSMGDDEFSFDSPDVDLDGMGDHGDLAMDAQHEAPTVSSMIEVQNMISKIEAMQNGGMSSAPAHYDVDALMSMPVDRIQNVYKKVMGEQVAEEDANWAGSNGATTHDGASQVDYDADDLFPSGQTTNAVKRVSNTAGDHSDNPMATVDPIAMGEDAEVIKGKLAESFKQYMNRK